MRTTITILILHLVFSMCSCIGNSQRSVPCSINKATTDSVGEISSVTNSMVSDNYNNTYQEQNLDIITVLTETSDTCEIVATHESVPDIKGKLAKAYFVDKQSGCIIDSLTISRYKFVPLLPWVKDIRKFEITSFIFTGKKDNCYDFYINICEPDTDNFYGFFYTHKESGDSIAIDESLWVNDVDDEH